MFRNVLKGNIGRNLKRDMMIGIFQSTNIGVVTTCLWLLTFAACDSTSSQKFCPDTSIPLEKHSVLTATVFDALSNRDLGELVRKFVIAVPVEDKGKRILFPEEENDPEVEQARTENKAQVGLAVVMGQNIIDTVDGKEPKLNLIPKPDRPIRLELLPGRHTILTYVRFYASLDETNEVFGRTQSLALSFDAELGHTYRVRAKAMGRLEKWSVWIEDTATKEVVASPVIGMAVEQAIIK